MKSVNFLLSWDIIHFIISYGLRCCLLRWMSRNVLILHKEWLWYQLLSNYPYKKRESVSLWDLGRWITDTGEDHEVSVYYLRDLDRLSILFQIIPPYFLEYPLKSSVGTFTMDTGDESVITGCKSVYSCGFTFSDSSR